LVGVVGAGWVGCRPSFRLMRAESASDSIDALEPGLVSCRGRKARSQRTCHELMRRSRDSREGQPPKPSYGPLEPARRGVTSETRLAVAPRVAWMECSQINPPWRGEHPLISIKSFHAKCPKCDEPAPALLHLRPSCRPKAKVTHSACRGWVILLRIISG
jgi:hypothetical protein